MYGTNTGYANPRIEFSVGSSNGVGVFYKFGTLGIHKGNIGGSDGFNMYFDGNSCTINDRYGDNILSTGVNLSDKLFAVVQRTMGNFYVLDNTLFWPGVSGRIQTHQATSRGGPFCMNYLCIAQLGSPWNTDYGIATNRIETASAGETTTSEVNAIIEATWTVNTGDIFELDVRRTDDDNRWVVRGDQAGSTIKLIERNAGIETERSSAAQTWTNGASYRLVVTLVNEVIRSFTKSSTSHVSKNIYASAIFNQTATGVKTSHAVSNLIAWPCTLSGAALAELQRYTA